MLFGQSIFQSVLTRLNREHEEDEPEETGTEFRILGLGMGFVSETVDTSPAPGTGTEAYFAFMPDIVELPEPPALQRQETDRPSGSVVPLHLMRLSPEEIAKDLSISQDDTEAVLAEKRRQFAKANHPDLVPEEYRQNANIRMTTANLLIDKAIKERFWR